MKLTIRKRLLLANLATLACVAICGAIGFLAVRSQGMAMDGISANGAAMKDQLQADMAHDAIRGDVLAALVGAANLDSARQAEAAKDLVEHTGIFRERLTSMAAKTRDPAILRAMTNVGPDTEAYLASAERVVKTAMTDKDAAQAALAGFMVQFGKLEESMGALSERIEKASEAAAQTADTAAASARVQIMTVSVLSMLLAMAMGLMTARAIVRPLDAAIGSAARIAEGDLCSNGSVVADGADTTETGRLIAALSNMRSSLH